MVVLATLVVNAGAALVAVANGWPAEFDAHNDPHRVSEQWIASGTAPSPPRPPLAALTVFVLLVRMRSRWFGVVGALGATLVGLLALIGELGEPTTMHPVDAVEELFHLTGVLLAVALVLAGSREASRRLRRAA